LPELECVGGPLDGQMRHFYGDEFPYPDDVWPVFPFMSFLAPIATPEPRRCGTYVQDPHHIHPGTGARRSVWLWRPPRPRLGPGEAHA